MNRERTKALLPILQAFAEGKEIQYHSQIYGGWITAGDDMGFEQDPDDYRIKPQPVLRPWLPSEVPKFFMARRALTDDVELFRTHLTLGGPVYQDRLGLGVLPSLQTLLDCWIHVNEDGTESPCGAYEEPQES